MINLFRNRTAKNAGWIIVGRVAQMVISLIVSLFTARYLGPSNYGLINYAAAYIAFFCSFCNLGTNTILVKEILDHPKNEGMVLGTTLVLRGVSSVLSAIIIVCIVGILDSDEPITIWVTVLSSLSVVFHIFEIFNFWFQSKLESKISAIATLVAYCATAIYRIVLMINNSGVLWFAFSNSVDYIVVALILFLAYKKYNGDRLSFSLKYGKVLLGKSYHFIISGLMVSIYAQTDKLMLKQMISDAEIGYYSTASSLCNIWCFVLSAIISSMVPTIIQAFKSDAQLFKRRNKQLYAIVFYVSMFVSVCFTVGAPLIIKILYGEAYLSATAPLRIITWYTAFSYLGVARDTWIVCNNQQKYLKYLYLSAAIANVILNLLFIPALGASGAALASLTTQILTIVLPLFIRDMRENTIWIFEAILLKDIFSTNKKR